MPNWLVTVKLPGNKSQSRSFEVCTFFRQPTGVKYLLRIQCCRYKGRVQSLQLYQTGQLRVVVHPVRVPATRRNSDHRIITEGNDTTRDSAKNLQCIYKDIDVYFRWQK